MSSRWQSRCYGLSQLWEQVADPFPWSLSCLVLCVQPSWGEIVSVCSLLLRLVFPNISIPLFSSSQVMFQVGWQSTARSYRRSRKFVSSVQKHVLTVCATSGGIFTPKAILFCSHMTQYSWQILFAHPAKAKHILHKWNQKKRRSFVAIVSRILLREAIWRCQKTRLELSLVIQFKNKRLLYGSYKCATTDTLKIVLASMLHNGYYSITL